MTVKVNELFPDATATGDLGRTPFAHVLVYIWSRKISGTLDVRNGKRSHLVYFSEGKAGGCSTGESRMTLGEFMIKRGKITQVELDQARKLMKKDGTGEIEALKKLGLLNTQLTMESQQELLISELMPIFNLDSGPYGFFEGRNMVLSEGGEHLVPVHSLRVLMEGVRHYGTAQRIDPHISGLDGKAIVFQNLENLEHFNLRKREKQFIRKLVGTPISTRQLGLGDPAGNLDLRRVLYVLLITKAVRIASPEENILESPQYNTVPPAIQVEEDKLDPKILKWRDHVQKFADKLINRNYFEMLGVDTDSDAAAVRQAYFSMIKNFHPQLADRTGLVDLKPTLEYITMNLNEAQSVLSDPDAHEGYLMTLASRGRTSEPQDVAGARAIVSAEAAFQRAKEHYGREEYDKALKEIDTALVERPGEPEYMALDTWIRALKRAPEASVEDLIEVLHRAHSKSPQNFSVNLFLGRLYRRSNRIDDAQIYLNRACEIDPESREAARDLEMLEKEAGYDRGRDSSMHSGLLDVIFGRRKK